MDAAPDLLAAATAAGPPGAADAAADAVASLLGDRARAALALGHADLASSLLARARDAAAGPAVSPARTRTLPRTLMAGHSWQRARQVRRH